MITHNINPIALDFNIVQIRWYGIIYALGFLITTWYLRKYSDLKKEQVYDYIFYAVLGVVIGARIFEVLIWEPQFYFSNPAEIIKIWNGGLSFHGGLLGLITVTYLYAKKINKNFWHLVDLVSIPGAIALGLGRVANFINAELYGKITSLPWCVNFPTAEGCRHPTQIYESLKNFLIFSILHFKNKSKLKRGIIFANFILFYGVLRFTIEFIKEGTRFYGLTTGQYLCLIMIIAYPFLVKHLEK